MKFTRVHCTAVSTATVGKPSALSGFFVRLRPWSPECLAVDLCSAFTRVSQTPASFILKPRALF